MIFKKQLVIVTLLLLSSSQFFAQNTAAADTRPRTIVTTDGEIDDVDSYIRLLLYANEFRLEGLIYSSSMWHYKGDGRGTKFISEMEMTQKIYGERTELRWPGTEWMEDLLAAYAAVQPNLARHAEGYPTADYLRSIVRVGNIDFEGEMEKVTPGSELIREKLLDDAPGPIYLQAWGGTNTIARALKSIETAHKNTPAWAAIYRKVCAKAVIYAILDQDATYRKYVADAWPDLRVFYNARQFWCLAYFWKTAVPAPLQPFFEGKFMRERLIEGHGPLLKKYYAYGDGQKQAGDPEHIHGDPTKLKNGQWGSFEPYDFISEGDSPAFLHLVDVGLGNLENPQFGGWGGRLVQSKTAPNRWEDGDEAADFNPFSQKTDLAYAQTRWLEALQLDFAARADWCVAAPKDANHPPQVRLETAAQLTARPGEMVSLRGAATDPDSHALSCRWWQYEEVGTFRGKVEIHGADSWQAAFVMPAAAKPGESIHFILEVRDNGQPALTRYQRVVATVSER